MGWGKERLSAFQANHGLKQDLSIGLIVVCVAIGAWSIGLLQGSTQQAGSVGVVDVFKNARERFTCQSGGNVLLQNPPAGETLKTNKGTIVVSKNGSKYHFTWCPGAGSIKEENKIWFSSEEEAKSAGYTKAANCK